MIQVYYPLFLINDLASLTSTLINLDVEEMSNCLA
jgi:hypothetical protein